MGKKRLKILLPENRVRDNQSRQPKNQSCFIILVKCQSYIPGGDSIVGQS